MVKLEIRKRAMPAEPELYAFYYKDENGREGGYAMDWEELEQTMWELRDSYIKLKVQRGGN